MIPIVFALVAMLIFSLSAAAATTVVVTPANQQGWSTADTRPGGAVNFTADPSAPSGDGALQLTTDSTTTAKAQYMHETNTPLSSVTNLSYWSYQDSASFPSGAPSYQLALCLGGIDTSGTCIGFTTMVYEPYQNGVVSPDTWQSWDVDAGQFWSSRSVSQGMCTVVAGGGGAPFYTLAGLQAACPDAVVNGFGVNIGSNNPSYDVRVDLVTFNDTTYDFELTNVPDNKDECKKGGWQTVTDADGYPFKNQGDCVSYVATSGKNK
jgi:hypothetical protein